MEIENLFNEWSIAYRAKGGKITVSEEELFADFFRWLKSKAAEQSVQSDICPRCEGAGQYADYIGKRVCSLCDGTGSANRSAGG